MLDAKEDPDGSRDPDRFYCPYPGCKRSFAELWRLKVHYRAPPDIRGSGKERGHGTELAFCPKCNKALKPGKHHVGCSAGKTAPRQASKRTRTVQADGDCEAGEAEGDLASAQQSKPQPQLLHSHSGTVPQPGSYGQAPGPAYAPFHQHYLQHTGGYAPPPGQPYMPPGPLPPGMVPSAATGPPPTRPGQPPPQLPHTPHGPLQPPRQLLPPQPGGSQGYLPPPLHPAPAYYMHPPAHHHHPHNHHAHHHAHHHPHPGMPLQPGMPAGAYHGAPQPHHPHQHQPQQQGAHPRLHHPQPGYPHQALPGPSHAAGPPPLSDHHHLMRTASAPPPSGAPPPPQLQLQRSPSDSAAAHPACAQQPLQQLASPHHQQQPSPPAASPAQALQPVAQPSPPGLPSPPALQPQDTAAAPAHSFHSSVFDDIDLSFEMDRIPSPPPLPVDFPSSCLGGGTLFNFAQFSQPMPRGAAPHQPPAAVARAPQQLPALQLPDAPGSSTQQSRAAAAPPLPPPGGEAAALSAEVADLWSPHAAFEQHADGDIMQLLFGETDKPPCMATMHLHQFLDDLGDNDGDEDGGGGRGGVVAVKEEAGSGGDAAARPRGGCIGGCNGQRLAPSATGYNGIKATFSWNAPSVGAGGEGGGAAAPAAAPLVVAAHPGLSIAAIKAEPCVGGTSASTPSSGCSEQMQGAARELGGGPQRGSSDESHGDGAHMHGIDPEVLSLLA